MQDSKTSGTFSSLRAFWIAYASLHYATIFDSGIWLGGPTKSLSVRSRLRTIIGLTSVNILVIAPVPTAQPETIRVFGGE